MELVTIATDKLEIRRIGSTMQYTRFSASIRRDRTTIEGRHNFASLNRCKSKQICATVRSVIGAKVVALRRWRSGA